MTDVVNALELNELSDSAQAGKSLIKRDFSLVNHVEVEVAVEVGHASMTIEALFALKAGDVITLKQQVNDPLTVILAGKPVARGNLVAVDDSLGVYITEII